MNPIILILTLIVACSVAAPLNYVSNNKSFAGPTVTILKQINQLNDDGSYTFGYEASDGSFRVESMDAKGYLTGRYGYVDSNGQQQETEYVAGKMFGQSVGFQARGTLIPIVSGKSQPFPLIRTATKSVEQQKALDYQHTSVDDNEDGFPDSLPVDSNAGAGDVRLLSPAKDSYNSATTITRTADPNAATVSDVRVLLTPTKTTNKPTADDARLVSQSKSSYGLTDAVVRVVEKTGDTHGKIGDTRVAIPTRVFYEPVVVREVNLEKATNDNAPSSIIKQKTESTITNIKQLGAGQVNIVRSPSAVYEKSAVNKSTGRLEEFLQTLKNNNKNVGKSYDTNDSSGTISLNEGQFQQDFQLLQEAQPIQGDSISVDSIGFSSTI